MATRLRETVAAEVCFRDRDRRVIEPLGLPRVCEICMECQEWVLRVKRGRDIERGRRKGERC